MLGRDSRASLPLCSQTPAPLTLDECVRLALAAPSQVSLAKLDVEIAQKGVTAARSNFLPTFGISNGFIYNTPYGSSPSYHRLERDARIPDTRGRIAGTRLERTTAGRVRQGQADQRISQAQLQIMQRDLKRAVTAAYYRLLLARHLVTANEDDPGRDARPSRPDAEALRRRRGGSRRLGQSGAATRLPAAGAGGVATRRAARQSGTGVVLDQRCGPAAA